jgi:HPt (histidine-containing phosphotransfer) domain-containing protein
MPEARDPTLDALLAAERAEYAKRSELRVAEIVTLLRAGDSSGARRGAHKLSGSAGTYGYPWLSKAARAIETALVRGEPVGQGLIDDLRSAGAAVLQSVGETP